MLKIFVFQMMVRDETIQKLNSDIGKLKAKHQDKVSEIQKQTETIKKLQDVMTKSHSDLDKTRKQSEEEVCKCSYLPCLVTLGTSNSSPLAQDQ